MSGPGAKQARKRKVRGPGLVCREGEAVINLSTEWNCEELSGRE